MVNPPPFHQNVQQQPLQSTGLAQDSGMALISLSFAGAVFQQDPCSVNALSQGLDNPAGMWAVLRPDPSPELALHRWPCTHSPGNAAHLGIH